MTQETAPDRPLSVLYNGACPVCTREIEAYRRVAVRDGLPLEFEDLNTADLARWGVGKDAARRRLHVRQGEAVLAGLPAFVALWRQMPRLRWLAWLVSLPGIAWLAEAVYERLLAPGLAALDRRRRARACPARPLSRSDGAR